LTLLDAFSKVHTLKITRAQSGNTDASRISVPWLNCRNSRCWLSLFI